MSTEQNKAHSHRFFEEIWGSIPLTDPAGYQTEPLLDFVGLIGLYARLANKTGWTGFVGFLLTLFPMLVLMFVIVSCSNAPSPSPTALPDTATPIPPTVTPSPTSEPTVTPLPTSEFRSFRSANCCKAKTIESGKYELPSWLGIPLTMDVGAGWSVLNEKEARLFLLAGKGQNEFKDPSQVLVFMGVPEGDPQSVLASIKESPELAPVGEITETTIAGFSGWQFEAAAKPNPSNKGNAANSIPAGAQNLPAINKYFAPGFLWTTWTAEPRLRFIALDVGENVLLLEIESPPAEFEGFASKADQVLQSLEPGR